MAPKPNLHPRMVLVFALILGISCTSDPPVPPPSSPIVALTPTEYNNTIRDLFGMPTDGQDWPNPPSIGQENAGSKNGHTAAGSRAWPWDFPSEVGLESFEGMADGQISNPYGIEQLQKAAMHFAPYALNAPFFFTCDNWVSLSQTEQESCGWQSIQRFAQRAWRRPISDDEQTRLQSFWTTQWSAGTPEQAIVLTVAGILQTPAFLYRIESGRTESQRGDAIPLTSWEMASRLSYFLWDTMPDSPLFGAAAAGRLRTADQIQAAARRMLEDPKARSAVVHFHNQWLGTTNIHKISPARRAYGPAHYGLSPHPLLDTSDDFTWPTLLINVRRSMALETDLFVERTLFDGVGTFEALLSDNHGYMSRHTLPLYGDQAIYLNGPSVQWTGTDASAAYGQAFSINLYPAEFPTDQRAGLLTLPSVLALGAHPVHPAPILRGKFLIERIACQYLGQPPAGAEGEAPPDTLDATSTNRERTEVSTSPAQCAACHDTLNPSGFAFENYDSMGAWRTTDNGQPVNATGTLHLAEGESFTFNNAVELARQLSKSPRAKTCYALRWARYATGIHLAESDTGVSTIQNAFLENDNVKDLLVSITGSDLFRYLNAGGNQ